MSDEKPAAPIAASSPHTRTKHHNKEVDPSFAPSSESVANSDSVQDKLADDELDRDLELRGGVEGRDLKLVHSVNNVASIPNGGLQAWLQVAGAFALFFNTWGILNTFGVYQTFYETDFLNDVAPSTISWIGSVQATLLLIVGAASGPVYDAGYFKGLIWTGSLLIVFGHMMLSLCTEYYQVFLAQAVCVGLGAGCLFIPSVAILSTYFNTKLALATGLAASGSSLGGVIYPVVLYRLIPEVGFGWATRIIGFIALALFIMPLTFMKVRVLPAKKRPLVDWSAFKQPSFVLFVIAGIPGFMGLYSALFYVQLYAIQTGITDVNLGFYLIAILNAASIFGRILPNILAVKVGPFNVFIPCTAVTGVLLFCLIPIHSVGSIIVWNLLFGFFSGSFVSLPPTIIVHLTENRALIGTRLGMCFSVIAIGVLTGGPIAGAILDSSGFNRVWIYGGAAAIGSAILFTGSRICYRGTNFLQKA